jgi:hypothetical protein
VKLLLGCPHSGQVVWNMSEAAWRCSQNHEVEVMNIPSSLLALSFNILYAEALNRNEAGDGIDLFAMLHSDLAPQGFWADVLVDEMLEKKADLVSCVNVIKDDRAVTSSGVAFPGVSWRARRRFTLHELANFPETFNAADVGYEGMVLLHNTGCWVADIRKPLFHEADEDGCLKAFFTINDRVVRNREGRWQAEVEPEDWFFSRRLFDLGATTYITRKVVTKHYGLAEMDNCTVRGQERDEQLDKIWAESLIDDARELVHALI